MKKIKKTKQNIAFLFTIIIFLIFILVWTWFFLLDFYLKKENQLSQINNIIKKTYDNKIIINNRISLDKEDLLSSAIYKKSIWFPHEDELWIEMINYYSHIKNIIKNISKFTEDTNYLTYNHYLRNNEKYKIFTNNYIIFDINQKRLLFTNENTSLTIDYLKILKSKQEIFYINNSVWFKMFFYDKNWDYSYLVIYFEKEKYSFESLKKDLIIYYSFIFFSMFFIYLIGNKFINFIFKPIESNINDMESFTHNAWHELNTPLANISSSVQLLNEIWKYDQEIVNDIIWEVNKSSGLIDTLKNISNIDTIWEYKYITVSNEIKEIIKSLKSQIKNKEIDITLNIIEDFKIKIQLNHFYSLFYNLLSNSIKYNNLKWNIEIKINKKSIIIEDNWFWIKKENLDKIFLRFYREEEHRNNQGLGLGLSIVNKIIELNNWKIDIKSEVWVWTKIEITF